MAFEDLHRPLGAAGFRGAIRAIIIATGIILVLQQFFGAYLVDWFGLTPYRVLHNHWWWQIFTYQFLHGGLFHWLFNMFVFWMFGRELETRWGTPYFLEFCLICGLGSALCVLLLSPHSTVPSIGSSGMVYGLLVAFAMVYPDAVLYLYFLIPVKAWQAAALFAVVEFFAGFDHAGSHISSIAHLGGMLTGYLYLRFGWEVTSGTKRLFRHVSLPWGKGHGTVKDRRRIELHEVTDDLVKEVDRILDKVLTKGVDSLTPKEKDIMDRYSKRKH